MTNRQRLWLGVLLLLFAAFLRIVFMDAAPPGLQHDEIFKAEEGVRLVEHGVFRVFYPTNQGHEGGYVWLLGLSYLLFGKTLLMIKFPAIACGLLTVALIYRLAGEAYDDRVAVAAGGLTAVSFWAVFISRVGLRAVMLPVVVAFFLWQLYRLCWRRASHPRQQWLAAVLAGAALGGSLYTYTAAPVLYPAFGAFTVLFWLWDRVALRAASRGAACGTFRRVLPRLGLVALLGIVLALPMVNARLNSDEGLERASVITEPWKQLRAGNAQPVLEGALKLAGMFAFTGDPEWRYNVAERPLFLLPVGLLVYLGGALALVKNRRQPFSLLILILALLGMIPSMLTTTPPSYLRSVVMLPSVMILIGLALAQIGDWLSRANARRWGWPVILAVLVATALADYHAYFVVWPRNAEVNAIYRDDLETLAQYAADSGEPLVLASTPDEELDPLIVDYIVPPGQGETAIAFFNGGTTILLSEAPALLAVSPLSAISPAHAHWLEPESGTTFAGQLTHQGDATAYELYRLNATFNGVQARLADAGQHPLYLGPAGAFPSAQLDEWATALQMPVSFGEVVELIGVELPRETVSARHGINLQLYFRPLITRQEMPLSVFVHLMTPDQTIVAQRDLLDTPSRGWQPEMIILQDTYVPFWEAVEPGQYILAMGVYNWHSGERLAVWNAEGDASADRVILGMITVIPEAE